MRTPWTVDDLSVLQVTRELHVAVRRDDGSARRPVPVWVVCFDGDVYVRSWHRRDTGWFGAGLRSRRARVRVPGLEVDVEVEDVGDASPDVTAGVDAAYRSKYGAGAGSMVTPAAAETTLRLTRGG